jgi:acyl carrier protein
MDSRLLEILRRHLRYARSSPIDQDASLRDLGLDSMQAIELLFDVESEFGIEVPDELLTEQTFATAATLWSAIARVSAAGGAALPRVP